MLKAIEWRIAFALSSAGFVYGALTVFAVIQGFEHWIASLSLLGIGKFAALLCKYSPLRTAFASGFLAGLWALWTQASFIELYFINNPAYRVTEIPWGLEPEVFTFVLSPIGALFSGAIALFSAVLVTVSLRLIRKWSSTA